MEIHNGSPQKYRQWTLIHRQWFLARANVARAVSVEPHSPLHEFDAFLARFGEPPCTANLAAEAILLQAAKREGVSALLDGHDADALFTPTSAYLTELFRRLGALRL